LVVSSVRRPPLAHVLATVFRTRGVRRRERAHGRGQVARLAVQAPLTAPSRIELIAVGA